MQSSGYGCVPATLKPSSCQASPGCCHPNEVPRVTPVFRYVAVWKGKQSVGLVLRIKMRHTEGAQEAWILSSLIV